MPFENKTISFIGAGVMGEAMIKGLLHKKLIPPTSITAADPREFRCNDLKETYGIQTTMDNKVATANADVIVFSIKPQVFKKVLGDIRGHINPDALLLSIAAGYKIERITSGTGLNCVARAMPNTPGQIGQGITVWTATPDTTDMQREWVEAVLGAMGETLYVQDEPFMDMATALNGSGPSYVFLLMEAMIDAGVHMGFSRRDSQKLVLETMKGSVAYAIDSGLHPAQLRNQVTSPGGTSAAALYQLEKGGVRTVFSKAIWAAYRRSKELGENGD